jgi:hypothetical protein
MKTKLNLLVGFVCTISFTVFQSCGNDPDPVSLSGKDGFYIVNEGAFGNNNASLSFYDREKDVVSNDVFRAKNGRPLGDQAQSMTIFEGKGYIVVQNSGKVEVIDMSDLSSIATITEDVESPRYFIGVTSTKGYLSDWGADGVTGKVRVIDLANFKVTKSFFVGSGPNRFLKDSDRVFLVNAGGFGKDNRLIEINATTDEITNTFTVGDNPTALQKDKDGNIWVACAGNIVYNGDFSINKTASTTASLRKLATDGKPLATINFPEIGYGYLTQLEINLAANRLFFNYFENTFTMEIAEPYTSEPLVNKIFYGLAIDPFTGDLIGCVAPNFSSAGKIEVYSSDGKAKASYNVGIGPNGVAYK